MYDLTDKQKKIAQRVASKRNEKNKNTAWELSDRQKQIAERVRANAYDPIAARKLYVDTTRMGSSIIDRVNSEGYRNKGQRTDLSSDYYDYVDNLKRLKLYGYDTDSAVENAEDLHDYIGESNGYYAQFENDEEYESALLASQQFYADWGKYKDAADYDTYSKMGADIVNPEFGTVRKEDDIGNIVSYSRDNYEKIAMGEANNNNVPGSSAYHYMTDDEVGIYNYLLAKEGKESAQAFLDSIAENLSARHGTTWGDEITSMRNPVGKFLVQGGMSIATGLDQWSSGIKQIGKEERLPTSVTQFASNTVQEDLGTFGNYLYGAGVVVGNMLPSILASYLTAGAGTAIGFGAKAASTAGQLVGAATLGTSASGNAYNQAIAEGYSPDKARTYGLLVGASEGVLQYALGGISKLGGKLGLSGQLASKIAKIDNAFARIAAKGALNIGREIREEELQLFIEPALRSIIFGEDYDLPTIEEMLETAIVTALSTGALESPGIVGNELSDRSVNRYYADTYGANVGDLAVKALEINPNNEIAKNVQAALAENKEVSGRDIRKLLEGTQTDMGNQTREAIQQGAAERLTQLGETGDIQMIAAAVAKQAVGETLTRAESSAIKQSVYGLRVANELNMENMANETYSSEWARDINQKRMSEVEEYQALLEAARKPQETAKVEEVSEVAQPQMTATTVEETPSTAQDATLEEISKGYGKQAGAMVSTYIQGQDVASYAYAYNAAYNRGKSGVSLEATRGLDSVAYLTEEQLVAAYMAGQDAASVKAPSTTTAKKGGVLRAATQEELASLNIDGETVTVKDLEKSFKKTKNYVANTAYRFLSALTQVTGVNVVLYQSKANADGYFTAAQGAFNWSNDMLYIDVNAGLEHMRDVETFVKYTLQRTFGHEFTHFCEKWNPVAYNEFRRFVLDKMTESMAERGVKDENGNIATADYLIRSRIAKSYNNAYNAAIEAGMKPEEAEARANEAKLSYDMASREVVADGMTDIFRESKFAEEMAEQHRTIFQKLIEQLKKFIADLRANFNKLVQNDLQEANYLQTKYIDGEIRYLEGIVEKWDAMAKGAVEAYNAAVDKALNMSNEEAFLDSEVAVQNQIRPPYTDGSKAFNAFVENLEPEARKTFDLFYGFYQKSRINNALGVNGKPVKKINISSVYLRAQEWNDMLAKDKKWAAAARELAEFLPSDVRKQMGMNEDGTLTPKPLEEEFKMPSSLAQRLVDALPFEAIDAFYELEGKTIELPKGKSRQSVGGEAYRRAVLDETRRLFHEGKLRKVGIGTMSKDRWGSLGFLAANGKTGASGDFTTICPQMFFNRGCWYCYRRAAMAAGVNNKLVAQSVWYTGEILRIKDEDIASLNTNGGLRIQSFGDWMPHFSAMLADVLYDAELRGLQVKIITKEPSMINYIAALREQGIGKNLYFNLSADYTIERAPSANNPDTLDVINPERLFTRDDDGGVWWKRAMTVEEASRYREKYPWVNVRIVATTLDEFIRGLRDHRVDVVTGYHGSIRTFERVDSTTGEHKVQVEALGDAGMPVFERDKQTMEWTTTYEGKTKTHKRLAHAIEANNLQWEYYIKSCCITGRCATCNGKCGKMSRDFNVKNATNRDAESVAYWQKEMQYGIEPEFGDMTIQQQARERAADYLAAVERGDMGTAQKMVDEAARAAGYDSPKLYHGTKSFGFTNIKTEGVEDGVMWSPFFATDKIMTAQTYSRSDKVRTVSEGYNLDYDAIVEDESKNWNDAVYDLAEHVSQLVGVRGWLDSYTVEKEIGYLFEDLLSGNVSRTGANNRIWDWVTQELEEDILDAMIPYWDGEQDALQEAIEVATEEDIVRLTSVINAIANIETDSRGNYQLYANTDNLLVVDAEENNWNNIPFEADGYSNPYTGKPKRKWNTRELSQYAKDNGYSGVRVKNVIDDGGQGVTKQYVPSDVYIFFNPQEQVKSADPVTYDDNGNVIPLSERFNPKNDDIRYSLRDSDGRQLSEAQADFFKDSKVRDENGLLKRLFHGTQSFGFTVFDKGKLDDGFSIFMTDNVDVAESYSGTLRVRSTVKGGDVDYNSLSSAEVVDWYNKRYHGSDIKLMDGDDIAAAREKYQKKVTEYIAKYRALATKFSEIARNLSGDYEYSDADKQFTEKVIDLLDRFDAADTSSRQTKILDQLSDARREYEKSASQVGKILAVGFSDAYELNNPLWRLEELSTPGEKVKIPSSIATYYRDIEDIRNDLYNLDKQEDGAGNYSVYANITNPLVINGNELNWDELILPKKYRQAYIEAIGHDPGEGRIYANTREIVKVAKHLGHDGVIFNDIVDVGAEAYDMYSSNVYVAFESNQVKDVDNLNPTENPDIRYQARETSMWGIDDNVISSVQNLGQKSVNAFTSQDLAKTEVFARKYWKELGVKSPFFRAWFGDWRANDKTPVSVAKVKGNARVSQHNDDTGWDIQVSSKVFDETRVHTESYNQEAIPFLPYINDIVKKAVLLDSYTMGRRKSPNSLMMHSFYAVADIGSGTTVIKLYVEEMYDPNRADTAKRAYQLQNVEKYQPTGRSSQKPASSVSPVATGNIRIVADLHAFVNQMDNNFNPKPASRVVNADGTPKVVYHGTSDDFTIFDPFLKGGKNGTAEGYGLYFADTPKVSGAYGGKLMRGYVNITKPATSYKKTIKQAALAKLIKATCEAQAKRMVADGEYAKVGDALRDTWVSNYVYTYGTTMDNAYRQVAASIISAEEHDMGIVQEVMAGMGIRSYEDAYDFYAILQDVTGIDGFITEWENSEIGGEKAQIAVALYSNQFKSATDNIGTFDAANPDIRYQLRDVPPVEPTSEKWRRGATFDEVKAKHPTLFALDADEAETRNPTQINGTVKTYRKVYQSLKNEGFDGTILDASSGLGYGTEAGRKEFGYDVDDIEPFPDAKYKPRYTDYSKLHKKYDYIISNAVLNVMPQDLRDAMVVKIGELLNDGGRAFINVRGTDVKNASSKVAIDDDLMEYFISNTGSYQKGFTAKELKAYLEDALGDGFTVTPSGMGGVSVIVTKNGISYQERTTGKTDREILEAAANANKGLSDGERDALRIFKQRLDKVNELQAKRKELGTLWQKQQFGGERDEAIKTRNRMKVLDGQLATADKALVAAEQTGTLQGVVDRARKEGAKAQKVRDDALLKRYRERRDRSASVKKYRERITKKVKKLTDMLLKNSDKQHIPEALKGAVGEFLATIDFTSKRQLSGGEATKKDNRFVNTLDKIHTVLAKQARAMTNPEEATGIDMYLDLPDGFTEELKGYIDKVRGAIEGKDIGTTYVNLMTAEELEDLDFILGVITESIGKANTLLANARFQQVSDAAESTIFHLNEVKEHSGKSGVEKFLNWDNTTPVYAFKRFGDGGVAIFEGLEDGWDKFAINAKAVIDFADKTYTEKEVKDWGKEVHTFDIDGREVQMTTPQIMSLYCLMKREQAQGHIFGGGMRIGNFVKKMGKRDKSVQQSESVHPSLEKVAEIVGNLSERQVAVADALQGYMNTTGTKWGNEVSMARFGYRAFTEENYFPIESDSNNLPAIDPAARANDLYRLLNMCFTKSLTPKANNALVVNDIFEVFAAHMSDMAKYNALALPVLDAMKFYNYKDTARDEEKLFTATVQKAVERAYGADGKSYFIQFMKDLNGTNDGGRSTAESFAMKMVGNYKVAAVGANLRVAILQPTAYLRASAVLDPKHLAKALTMKPAIDEMLEHSGIAVWKALGFYDVNIGRSVRDQIKHEDTVRDKVVEKSMVAAELMDRVTWGALWNACKVECIAKGEKDLMAATAKRFREVIYASQVVDSTMTRSQTMRSNSSLTKMLTSFMSEPTLSFNMLLDAYNEYNILKRKGVQDAWSKSKGKVARGLMAYGASAVGAAIAESLFDALRDDDDYETFLEKFWEAFWMDKYGYNGKVEYGNLVADLNPANKLPLVKDVFNWATGFENNRMDTQWLDSISDAVSAWKSESRPLYGKIYKTLQAVSRVSGLPISNLFREVATIYNNTIGTLTGKKLKTWEPSDYKGIKEAFEAGHLTKEEAAALLVEKCDYTASKAKSKAAAWEYQKENPDTALSDSRQVDYVDYARPAGIGVNVFQEYVDGVKAAEGQDIDGDGKSDKKEIVVNLIHSLPITKKQKDVLYLLDYSESGLEETPWH